MILTDDEIWLNGTQNCDISDFRIDPFNPNQVEPASYDFRLASTILRFTPYGYAQAFKTVDPLNLPDQLTFPFEIDGYFDLMPGEFLLGSSVERFTFGPSICGVCMGKSSLARVGLIIENAGLFDPGFEGTATLEIVNIARHAIRLTPGMLIGQMMFYRTTQTVGRPYGSVAGRNRYQGQDGPTEARRIPE